MVGGTLLKKGRSMYTKSMSMLCPSLLHLIAAQHQRDSASPRAGIIEVKYVRPAACLTQIPRHFN